MPLVASAGCHHVLPRTVWIVSTLLKYQTQSIHIRFDLILTRHTTHMESECFSYPATNQPIKTWSSKTLHRMISVNCKIRLQSAGRRIMDDTSVQPLQWLGECPLSCTAPDCRADSSAQGSSWTWILGEGDVNVMICQSASHHKKRTVEGRRPSSLRVTTGWLWLFFHLSAPVKDPKGTDKTRGSSIISVFVKCLSPSLNRIGKDNFEVTFHRLGKKKCSILCHLWVRIPWINVSSPPSAIIHYTHLHTLAGCSEVVRLYTHMLQGSTE